MKIIVFVGPSLPLAEAKQALAAEYRPPAARGDVYRAALARPWGIGIIDGYFEHVPAVWHKEILWAMSRGVHVFGAASMGALRAVELAAFGMEGVGEIFAAFREGELTDDDEVTIAHADADDGYRAASTALVDIRATLAAARSAGVLAAQSAAALLAVAKRTHYAERSYRRLLHEARAQHVDPHVLASFERWLPGHEVQQKRTDALLLLEHMRERALREPHAKRASFAFEHTDAFERFLHTEREPPEVAAMSDVVDELRLDASRYEQRAQRAWARLFALELAERLQIAPDESTYQQAVAAFRRARALLEPADVAAWLDAHQLDRAGLEELLRQDVQITGLRTRYADELEQAMLAELHTAGEYPWLARRAAHKRALLQQHGADHADLASVGLSERELVDWYMCEIGATNDHDAVMALSNRLDCTDGHTFLRLIMREYIYRQLTNT
jgi:hypothetical protein